ncbi:hypothetical protein JTE90_027031 [Oedothorax gibbosus]|uniref:Uncharacterized protein n=1 Tax=Oedothorax gibbosus TaxID=931172 RepID=A0AAV6UWF5_9ARAC|nr:hypothetical protein JTE90_027031 [Oedothorax gibbosus]
MSADRIEPPFSPPDCPWVSVSPGTKAPDNARPAGGQLNGSPVYIGRVYDEGDYLIGTALPDKGTCLYLSRKQEVKSTDTYDILTIDCGDPIGFEPKALDSNLLFVSGGNEDECLYTTKVIDGENTYIGWADKEAKKVYIPRESNAVLEDNYEIMIHKYLDRLCICPMPPNPPPF